MITYKIIIIKANYEEIKELNKFFKKHVPNYYTGLAGKQLCFCFSSESERIEFLEELKVTLETKTTKNFEIYLKHAVLYLRE